MKPGTVDPCHPTAAPRLTAVLVAGPRRRHAQAALDSLANQSLRELEVLLVDTVPDAAPLRHPAGVPIHELRRSFPGGQPEARTAAVAAARAPAVAFVEDHSVVSRGWAATVADAFASGPWSVVGYSFRNADDSRWAARACHAAVYGPWMAPAGDAEVRLVATNNLAFRRDVLTALGPRLPRLIFPDAVLQQELLRAGHRFLLAGRAECTHENPDGLGFLLLASFAHGRAMAGRRVEQWGWGWPRRLFYAAAVPVAAPLIRLWRLLVGVASHPRRWLAVIEGLPLAVAMYAAGAVGESIGYVAGAGRALEEYEEYELARERSSS